MSKLEDGMKVRREVLGDAHVDRSIKNASSFDLGFQEYITETVWGSIWTQDGLERSTRHMVTIAILAALGREHELELHLRASINTGVTPEQLREVFMHVAGDAGVPAANTAFALAKRILTEQGRLEVDEPIDECRSLKRKPGGERCTDARESEGFKRFDVGWGAFK